MKKIIFTLFILMSAFGIENASASTSSYDIWYGPFWAETAMPGAPKAQKLKISLPDDIGFDSFKVELERALADELKNQQFNLSDNFIYVRKNKIELNKDNLPKIMAALRAGTLTVSPKVAQ